MDAANRSAEVLVVGAGPTGLVLALWLKKLGVEVRIIDRAAEPGTTSRALAVQARTLEFYRQLGLSGDVVARGLEFTAVNLWVRGRRGGRVALGDIGQGLSPFPYVLTFPQDEHEKVLSDHLRRLGVEVERRTTLVDFVEQGGHVLARLELPDGTRSECKATYLAGCDGAHSRVREVLDIGFPGGTYERLFYVADVEFHGALANRELHVALDDADLVVVFPLKAENTARLIGTLRPESEAQYQTLGWNDVSRGALGRLAVKIDRVNWFSTYKVHHRVARQFRSGRAFLVGDAAHIHSPVGGQGMNTGIGDAVNLAWKLASVIQRRASEGILATYAPERMAFADRLVSTTDRLFTLATRDGFIARHVRTGLVPVVLPRLLNIAAARRFFFRTVSQTMLNYRPSELSEGRAGPLCAGDRLPWLRIEDGTARDNFTPLASLDWQVHVYGTPSGELAQTCADRRLGLHVFHFTRRAEASGFCENALYLVRPDGYIGFVDPQANSRNLLRYLDARGIRTTASNFAPRAREARQRSSATAG